MSGIARRLHGGVYRGGSGIHSRTVYSVIRQYASPLLRRLPQRSRGLLPILLVGALLLCHGVLGFAHQTSCHGVCEITDPPTSSSPAHDAHGSGYATGQAEDVPDGGQVSAGYFAAFLALFGVAFLGLLLGARRPCKSAAWPPYQPRYLPAFSCLRRGPSLPLLGVFRL